MLGADEATLEGADDVNLDAVVTAGLGGASALALEVGFKILACTSAALKGRGLLAGASDDPALGLEGEAALDVGLIIRLPAPMTPKGRALLAGRSSGAFSWGRGRLTDVVVIEDTARPLDVLLVVPFNPVDDALDVAAGASAPGLLYGAGRLANGVLTPIAPALAVVAKVVAFGGGGRLAALGFVSPVLCGLSEDRAAAPGFGLPAV